MTKRARGWVWVWIGLAAIAPAAGRLPFAGAEDAASLLKPPPRPARPALAPSALPLVFLPGERVALVGNSTAERMNLFGYFETLLQLRHAGQELVVRNFARPADEVGIRQRPNDYTALDDPLAAFGADTYLCFFGFNESFAGPAGVEPFERAYHAFLDRFAKQYPRDDTGAAPRMVLVSPLAFEPTGDPLLPEGAVENENLALYSQAVGRVATARGVALVDIFQPSLAAFTAEPGLQLTINGCHQNEAGDRALATWLDTALFGPGGPAAEGASFERLRAAVNDKAWVHQQDYRMVNGWYVYGGRRTWDTETFPREFLKIRAMVAVRDRYVWQLAQGHQVSTAPDDSVTGELFVPPTRFGDPRQKYSEAEELRYLSPEEFVKTCTLAPGLELKPFADESKFPELANPVQISFDDRGRLWVATMPTYPMWRPGDPRPDDKLLIFADENGDGVADSCKVFLDGLHCPTGFEFFRDGVLVVSQPRLLWARDTDGDDQADQVVHFLDGFATDDTHHTIGAFEANHIGLLHMLEGVAMSTTVETPWGPLRNFGSPGAYVLDPAALRLRHYVTPGYGNPWCYVFNQWGQGIVGDGTGAVQHWDTPLSGAQFGGRMGLNPVFNNEGMRPAIGSEFLVSRSLPDEVQGQFTYACVINMNGMPRFQIDDDGAGYNGHRLKHPDGRPDDLLSSTDKHFRPVDPQIGPDGALWFGDWSNALIGHMQYSQRDPNRDHQRGRIYRLTGSGRPALEPVTQHGKPIEALLDQLRQVEWRTRQRARRALADRPSAEVLAATRSWADAIKDDDPQHDRLLCEALWVQAAHHAVETTLLGRVLALPTFEARAAATRVVADQRQRLTGAYELLVAMAQDEHPRVRTEAWRGLSFCDTLDSCRVMLAGTERSLDYWEGYTLDQALAANEAVWRPAFLTGTVAADSDRQRQACMRILARSKTGGAAAPYLSTLLGPGSPSAEERNKALQALADMPGDAGNGREVFARSCTACHKIGELGREYGPDLVQTAPKRTKFQLAQSIIDPNAEVDEKYVSTAVLTSDGRTITGLLVSESDVELVLFDGKDLQSIATADIEERHRLKQSSMPEGLAASLAPAEFLDVLAFLATLKP